MTVIALPSFSKGVIGPSLHARVDTAMYRVGLKTARNCIIHPYGGISNRPGTACIGPVKDHTVGTTRLFKFHLADIDQYVLEFGDLYIRVIRNDEVVTETAVTITAATQANPVVITASSHGYSNGDEVVLRDIGGMVEISGNRYIVQATTVNTFELTSQIDGVNVDGTGFTAFSASSSDVVAKIFELTTTYAAADLATLKLVQSGNVITITHPTYAPRDLTRTDHNVWSLTTLSFAPALAAPTNLAATADTNTNFQVFHTRDQTVRYQVTSIADTDEFFEESLAIEVTLTDSSDPPFNTLTWTAESAAQRYGVYRQDNGLYGLIGETEDTTFIDDNLASDLTISPPRARNPFTGTGNFPATSGYYEQRQLYGGSTNKPDTWYASQTGLRLNMSVSTPLQADDAITASLSSQDVQVIRHFVPLDDLIVLTNAGEWRINSGGDSHFSADTVKQKPQEFWGSDHMQPIIIGKTIFYVEDGGGRVRSLGFSLEADGYQSSDMNLLANHLLVEDGPASFIVTDWAHQQFPEPRLYIVRSDGIVLTMTFNKEQQVIAWTTWDTDGTYESVTSLRRSLSNVEDGVYFIVKRLINGKTVRLIERLHTRKFADIRDANFLDAAHRLDAPITVTDITNDTGSNGQAVITATGHGFSDGDTVEITDVNWTPDIDEFGNETNPDIWNNRRFTVANSTTDTLEFLDFTTVGASEGWDLTTATFDKRLDTGTTPTDPTAMTMSSDGTKIFIANALGGTGERIVHSWTLSTAYDIGTATYDSITLDTAAQSTKAIFSIALGDSGTKLYIYHGSDKTVYQYNLSVADDLSTATYSGRSREMPHFAEAILWNDVGTRFYFLQTPSTDRIFEWSVSTAWQIDSTFTLLTTFFTPTQIRGRALTFKPDGLRMYLANTNTNLINQFDLSSAFDLSTVSDSGITFSVNSETNEPTSIDFKSDGTVFWVAGIDNEINQYTIPATASSEDIGKSHGETFVDGGVLRKCVTQISGLHCLEGDTVGVLLDGNVEPDYTVVNGIITIRDGRCVSRGSIGLPYTSDIETLNIELPTPPSTIQDKVKKITDVMIRFYKSRMPFIGPNNTDMIELKGRELETFGSPTELFTGDKTINIPPIWNTNGSLFIRMRAPVPMTILGLFPEMTVEDDL